MAVLLVGLAFHGTTEAACTAGQSGTVSVLYVNGITTSYSDADDDRKAVDKELADAITSGALKIDKNCLPTALVWNPTVNVWADVLETAYQLSISDTAAWSVIYGALLNELLTRQIITREELYLTALLESATVDKITDRATAALADGKLVILGHSQGNLFANRVYYDRLSVSQESNTAVVAVATPADRVPGGRYTTLKRDLIALLPGALIGNTDNGPCGDEKQCHNFLHSYLPLTSGRQSGPQILNQLIDAVGSDTTLVLSHDEGSPDTLFGGTAAFSAPQNLALQNVRIYLWVAAGFENSDTQGILLDADNFNQQLFCATDVRSASAWGAISGPTQGRLTTVGPFFGTQCNLIQGHHYIVGVHSADPFNNHIGWGGYSSDSTVFYQISLSPTTAVEPLSSIKVSANVASNKLMSIPCASLPDAATGHTWVWALSDHPVDPFNYSTFTYVGGTGPKPCADNQYVFDLSSSNYAIPANTDVYLVAWPFGGLDFQIVDNHTLYYGLVHWDGSVGTVK